MMTIKKKKLNLVRRKQSFSCFLFLFLFFVSSLWFFVCLLKGVVVGRLKSAFILCVCVCVCVLRCRCHSPV